MKAHARYYCGFSEVPKDAWAWGRAAYARDVIVQCVWDTIHFKAMRITAYSRRVEVLP